MRDLLLPRTDAAVLVQALVAGVVFASALLLARRNRELVLLVIGLGVGHARVVRVACPPLTTSGA